MLIVLSVYHSPGVRGQDVQAGANELDTSRRAATDFRLNAGHGSESAPGMSLPFFTIGHSKRPLSEFLGLLAASQVGLIVDVRAIPRSRTNPQYDCEALAKSLQKCQVSYQHLSELGGRRARTKNVGPDVNGFWENQSFHNYADYALGVGFRSGLAELRKFGSVRRCAVMCAEAVWWRCHRRIIADYLLAAGEHVFHILGPKAVKPASLTDGAKPHSDGTVTYPG